MPTIHDLARRLIALEESRDPTARPVDAAVRACQKLQVAISKLMGVAGFRSLLSRALAMAKDEVPSLGAVQLPPDCSLEGIKATKDAEAGLVVVAKLLGLLVSFIGEPLTLSLVRGAWPDEPMDESDRRSEGQS